MGELSGKAQKDGGGDASILNLRAASSLGESPTKSVSNAIMPPCLDGVRNVAKSDLLAASKLPLIELGLGAKKNGENHSGSRSVSIASMMVPMVFPNLPSSG